MDRTDWNLLVLLNQEKSMNRVADRLFLSQPAVSYRLDRMEKEFNRVLFLRDSKGIRLTSHGELLLSFAPDMLQKMEDIGVAMGSDPGRISGSITVGATSNFINLHLLQQLKAFTDLYPGIRVTVENASSRRLIERLIRKELMMCIVRLPGQNEWTGPQMELMHDQVVIISREPITDEYLSTHPLVCNGKDEPMSRIIDEWLRNHPAITAKDSTLSIRGDSRHLVSAVQNGFGWAVVTSSRLSPKDMLYTRPVLRPDGTPCLFETQLMYQESCQHYDAYRAFIEHCGAYDYALKAGL